MFLALCLYVSSTDISGSCFICSGHEKSKQRSQQCAQTEVRPLGEDMRVKSYMGYDGSLVSHLQPSVAQDMY